MLRQRFFEEKKMKKARVLYNFNAETDCELTILEGQILTITDTNVGEGWWSAK